MVSVIYFSLDFLMAFFPKYSDSLPYLKLSLIICPFILFKLGYMFNVLLKKYKQMAAYVLIYSILQITTLLIFKEYFDDVIITAIYSQALTTFLTLIISLLMNYYLVKLSVKNVIGTT
jgi:hypothetical protein